MNAFFSAVQGDRAKRCRFAILQLQFYLRRLTDPNLIASGIWDARSRAALTAFQKQQGLPPTGLADRISWQAVMQQGSEAVMRLLDPPPIVLPPILLDGGSLSPGQTGDEVTLLQIMLNRFLLTQPNTEPIKTDGVYRADTEAAVEQFRALHGLVPSPSADAEVYRALTAFFRFPASFE